MLGFKSKSVTLKNQWNAVNNKLWCHGCRIISDVHTGYERKGNNKLVNFGEGHDINQAIGMDAKARKARMARKSRKERGGWGLRRAGGGVICINQFLTQLTNTWGKHFIMNKIFHLAQSFRGPSLCLASSIAIACDEAEPSGGRRVRKSDIVHLTTAR